MIRDASLSDPSDQTDEENRNPMKEEEKRSGKRSGRRVKSDNITTPCQEILVEKVPSRSQSPNPQEHEQEGTSSLLQPIIRPPPQSLSEADGLVVEQNTEDLSDDDCFTYSDEDDDDGLYADAVAAASAALAGANTEKKTNGFNVDGTAAVNGAEVPNMIAASFSSMSANPGAFSSPSSSPSSSVASSSSPRGNGRRRRLAHRRRKQRGQANHRLPSQLPSLVEVREDGLRTPTHRQHSGEASLNSKKNETYPEQAQSPRYAKSTEEALLAGLTSNTHFYYGAVSSSPKPSPTASPRKRTLSDEEEKNFTDERLNPSLNIFSPGSTASTTTALTSPPVSPSGRFGRRLSQQRHHEKLPLRSTGTNGNVLSPLSDSAEVKSIVPPTFSGSEGTGGGGKENILRAGGAQHLWGHRRSSRTSRRSARRLEEEEARKEQAIRALWGHSNVQEENEMENNDEDRSNSDIESAVNNNKKGCCGSPRKRSCHRGKDTLFAILFVLQFAAMAFCAGWYGSSAISPLDDSGGKNSDEDADSADSTYYNPWKDLADDDFFVSGAAFGGKNWNTGGKRVHIDYMTVIQLTCVTGTYATVLSILTIGFMMILAKSLIHVALIFAIVVSLAWCIVGGLMSQYSLIPFLGIIAFALCVGYAVVVWERVPFAATILNTALYGMRCTGDVISFGFFMTSFAFGWTVLWMLAFIGVYDYINDLRKDGLLRDGGDGVLFFVFSLSYYWTFQVIKNVVQVTVAGTVGTWWFHPEQLSPCCSSVAHKSFIQSITSSFGSICFGSLVVHPAQAISRLIILFFPHLDRVPTSVLCLRRNGDGVGSVASWESSEADVLNGGHDFDSRPRTERALHGFTSRLNGVFNHWAFTYIGIHDHKSFLDAGKNASALFETREWTHIVADSLIHNVLLMTSIVIGGSAGCFGLMVEEVDGYSFTSFNKPMFTAFLIGSFIGFSLSNIFLSVVGSAVNTVILCYAAAPFEFHQNHLQLSNEMKDSWNQRWSNNFA